MPVVFTFFSLLKVFLVSFTLTGVWWRWARGERCLLEVLLSLLSLFSRLAARIGVSVYTEHIFIYSVINNFVGELSSPSM